MTIEYVAYKWIHNSYYMRRTYNKPEYEKIQVPSTKASSFRDCYDKWVKQDSGRLAGIAKIEIKPIELEFCDWTKIKVICECM